MRQKLLRRSKPVIAQWIIGTFIGLIIVLNVAYSDRILFDFYVKPTIAECYPSNQSDYCTTMREIIAEQLGIPFDKNMHVELGNVYWNELARQAVTWGFIVFLIRIVSGIMLHTFSGMRKIHPIDIFMALAWGGTTILLFYGGVVDIGYYIIFDEDIPENLPWLDDIGIFNYSQGVFGETDSVQSEDLWASLLIVLGLISLLWLTVAFFWNASKVKRVI